MLKLFSDLFRAFVNLWKKNDEDQAKQLLTEVEKQWNVWMPFQSILPSSSSAAVALNRTNPDLADLIGIHLEEKFRELNYPIYIDRVMIGELVFLTSGNSATIGIVDLKKKTFTVEVDKQISKTYSAYDQMFFIDIVLAVVRRAEYLRVVYDRYYKTGWHVTHRSRH